MFGLNLPGRLHGRGEMMFNEGWQDNWHTVDGEVELARKLILVFEDYLSARHKKGVASQHSSVIKIPALPREV